jgi:hypothetical protein
MAVPASFDEATDYLNKPESMTADQCEALAIARCTNPDGYPVVVSCWKVTREELDEINRTGRLWLMIVGNTMPPAVITGIKPV